VTEDGEWAWWRERRPPAELVHLDSAAAGRSSAATLAASAAHGEREAARGAYVAQAEAAVGAGGVVDLAALEQVLTRDPPALVASGSPAPAAWAWPAWPNPGGAS
jgi:hypothetical protein